MYLVLLQQLTVTRQKNNQIIAYFSGLLFEIKKTQSCHVLWTCRSLWGNTATASLESLAVKCNCCLSLLSQSTEISTCFLINSSMYYIWNQVLKWMSLRNGNVNQPRKNNVVIFCEAAVSKEPHHSSIQFLVVSISVHKCTISHYWPVSHNSNNSATNLLYYLFLKAVDFCKCYLSSN